MDELKGRGMDFFKQLARTVCISKYLNIKPFVIIHCGMKCMKQKKVPTFSGLALAI